MAAEDYINWGYIEREYSEGVIFFLDDFKIIKETEKAFLIQSSDSKEWLPKSQIIFESPPLLGMSDKEVIMSVPEWLARKKSLPWKVAHWSS